MDHNTLHEYYRYTYISNSLNFEKLKKFRERASNDFSDDHKFAVICKFRVKYKINPFWKVKLNEIFSLTLLFL